MYLVLDYRSYLVIYRHLHYLEFTKNGLNIVRLKKKCVSRSVVIYKFYK